MTELETARDIINEVDEKMAQLFERRMDAAKMVAHYKQERGIKIDDFAREEQMIKKNSGYIKNEEYRSYYVEFLKDNILISKKLQHRLLEGMKVAYSGVEGAFADTVAQKIFPDANCIGHRDFASAYKAVENGECDCAVLPIENSFNGDVGNVMDLAFFGSLYINGVYDSNIVQNLLAVPGASIKDIKYVKSHPQALGQCAAYIKKHNFEQIESVNTAVAAKEVFESGRKDIAAIGSEEAAAKFGLVKLDSHINESNANSTRFAVFSRTMKNIGINDERFIMLFTVKNEAGSLGKAISAIGDCGINLRALKSRPTKELVWDYYFYAEGEGNISGENGKKMLAELKKHCLNVKVLGSFEKEITL